MVLNEMGLRIQTQSNRLVHGLRFLLLPDRSCRLRPANPNGIQIHQPRVGGPRRTGEERLPWETVPKIHQL